MIKSPLPTLHFVAKSAIALTWCLWPLPLVAQEPIDGPMSLTELKTMQAEFERFREAHTPVQRERDFSGCDENIGRMCIWFGEDQEEEFPPELRETRQAREQLIRGLSRGFESNPDPWTLGQWVHYLVEHGQLREAMRAAEACGITDEWWCSALHGYALHVAGNFVEAEQHFRQALSEMSQEEATRWRSLRYIVPNEVREASEALGDGQRASQFEQFWHLSDPLYLFQGNDRLTDHFARLVRARNSRDALDPLGLEWGEDLDETLIRYGRNTGYGRTHNPGRMMTNGFGDTRRMVGFHHPKSRGYLFPSDFLEAPANIPPESWITAPRESRTWYAPPYAPEMRGLETQVGRFRRDDQMLVVGAYQPTVPDSDAANGISSAWDGGGPSHPISAALFLTPEVGDRMLSTRGRDASGVFTLEAAPGRYVSSLEVLDLRDRRAWRARQGVVQEALLPGMVDVSDLMILRAGAPLPDSLDEATPHIRPGVRVMPGERFGVVWEVYGLAVREPVRVTIGFSRGRPGFLERVGDFLGVLEPEEDIDITFDDTGPDVPQAVFRSIELQLPELDPGEYTLHLRLALGGREPLTISRPIQVDPAS